MVGLGLDNCQPSGPIHLGSQQHNGALSGHRDGTQGIVERPNRDLCLPTATSLIHRDYPQLRDLIEISVHQLQGSGQTEVHNYQQKCRQSGREKMELRSVIYGWAIWGSIYICGRPAACSAACCPDVKRFITSHRTSHRTSHARLA